MDRRAVFFAVASAACFALVPVAPEEHQWIALATAIAYAVFAVLSFLDFRSRHRER